MLGSTSDTYPGSETSSLAGGIENGEPKDLFDFLRDAQLEQYFLAFTTRLKVVSVDQIKYVEMEDMADIGMSRPEMRRLRKFFERECPQTAMGKLKKLFDQQQFIPSHLMDRLSRSTSARSASATRAGGHAGDYSHASTRGAGLDSALATSGISGVVGGSGSLLTATTRHLILPEELEIGNILGEGEFGRVHQGVWSPGGTGGRVQVAVKVLDKDKLCQEVSDFLKEVALMHSLDHPDIVRLFGVVMEQDALKMVTELAPLRSLLECLKEPAVRNSFPLTVLHSFAQQVAHGMEYLEAKRLIHRDLAARNILVFSKDKVKISDFGMSRALQLGKEYYQTNFNVNLKLPIAWCAPECINYLKFTSSSDVWAYGVTLWEMFSYGFQPWVGLTGQQILERIDEPKLERLNQPDACPFQHYELMRDCWKHEPKERPNFIQITNRLPRMIPERVQAVVDSNMMPTVCTDDIKSISSSAADECNSSSSQASTPVNGDETNKSLASLQFKSGDVIVILEKKSQNVWRGCTTTGRTGFFAPNLVRPYAVATTNDSGGGTSASLMRSPGIGGKSKQGGLSRRASLSDLQHRKRGAGDIGRMLGRHLSIRRRNMEHNFSWLLSKAGGYLTPETSRKQPVRGRLRAGMIGLPQNDFRHIGHVGFDGSIFGDVNFIKNGEQEKLPVNPVLPYKPSNDQLPGPSSLSLRSSQPRYSGSRLQAAKRGSPSGSCLTITTISDINSRLSTGTLTDVSSCMNDQLDDGEESPPYETLDQQQASPCSSTLSTPQAIMSHRPLLPSHQPPPLPPSRQQSSSSDNYATDSCDLLAGFQVSSQSDMASSFDFGSSLMDDIFKCLKMEDDQTSSTSSSTLAPNNPSRSQSLHVSECDLPLDHPPPTSTIHHPSDVPEVTRSPSKRQEAIVKPLIISTNKKDLHSSPDSSDSIDSSDVKKHKKKFHNFKLGGGDHSSKLKSLPIYAKPIKMVGGNSAVGGGGGNTSVQPAVPAKKQAPIISKPILISGPMLPTTAAPSLIPANNACALSVDTVSSGSTPSISPAASTTSVTSSGTQNSFYPSLPSSAANSGAVPGGGGVGALRAIRRGEGVFRVTGLRRPSVGEGVSALSSSTGGTLTRNRQPSLPIASKSTRFAPVPHASTLQPVISSALPSTTPQRRSSSLSISSSDASSSGGSLSGDESALRLASTQGGTSNIKNDQPSSFFESEKACPSPKKKNGSSPLSLNLGEEDSNFWGFDMAGLLGSGGGALNSNTSSKKEILLPASVKLENKVSTSHKVIAVDTDDDDIVRM